MAEFSVTDVVAGAFAAAFANGLHKLLQQRNWKITVTESGTGSPIEFVIPEANRLLQCWKFSNSGCGIVLARATGHKDSKSSRLNFEVDKPHDPSTPYFPRLGRFMYTNSATKQLDRDGKKNTQEKTHFELAPDTYSCLEYYTPAKSYAESKRGTGLAPEECVVAIFKLLEECERLTLHAGIAVVTAAPSFLFVACRRRL